MKAWVKRIDIILEAGEDVVLTDAGKIAAEFAKSFAEFENTVSFKTVFFNLILCEDNLLSIDLDTE